MAQLHEVHSSARSRPERTSAVLDVQWNNGHMQGGVRVDIWLQESQRISEMSQSQVFGTVLKHPSCTGRGSCTRTRASCMEQVLVSERLPGGIQDFHGARDDHHSISSTTPWTNGLAYEDENSGREMKAHLYHSFIPRNRTSGTGDGHACRICPIPRPRVTSERDLDLTTRHQRRAPRSPRSRIQAGYIQLHGCHSNL